MSKDSEQFCRDAVKAAPDIGPLFAEHLADNDEVLPHVFVADLARYVLAGGAQRRELVTFFEHRLKACTVGDDVENVIWVSFLEYLDAEEFAQALSGVDAPTLTEAWHCQRRGDDAEFP